MKNKTLAIITPTYNRGYIIKNLYESLKRQKIFDFVWYIIDDGSTDDTEEVIKTFDEAFFKIVYIKKENGGKHTAVNLGVANAKEELTFIVDSDDYISDDAVESILSDWNLYKNREDIVGLSYLRIQFNGGVIGQDYNSNQNIIGTFIDVRINKRITGDKAEIYRTKTLQKFPFPKYGEEKFLSESVVWNAIANAGGKLVFIPKGIYYCEYREDGLTSQGREKQLSCPIGTYAHAKAYLYKGIKISIRFKYVIMLIAITRFAGKTYKESFTAVKGNRFLYVFGFLPALLLRAKWKRKIGVKR